MACELRAYEMVEGTTPEEAGVMKQQMRVEEAQRLRRQSQQTAQQTTRGETTRKSPG